ncbi:MAG: hypothetical protein GC165_08790 [Armatimonadetes bacterium]|nr:hypothetical protein [Armatimonadota bacterium]
MSQHKPNTVPCPNCGKEIPSGNDYCASCGWAAKPPDAKPKSNFQFLWILLALLMCPLECCGACPIAITNPNGWIYLTLPAVGLVVFLILAFMPRQKK